MPETYQIEPVPLITTKLFEYDCTNKSVCNPYHVFLKAGVYQFECWGASGSDLESSPGNFARGGKGAYVSGVIKLVKDQSVFLYIGAAGSYDKYNSDGASSYNGGGASSNWASGGGGATDVRLVGGPWDDIFSLASRIIVAGAGGGANDYGNGGNAGNITGYDGIFNTSSDGCGESVRATGGSQTAGGSGLVNGSFGKGGSKSDSENDKDGGGGGSGYYGGGKAGGCHNSGAGGSSFVSGHSDCKAINAPNSTGEFTHSESSIHYSKLFFYKPIMKDGATSFLSPQGDNETGHTGNGAIKITILGLFETYRYSILSLKYYFLYISIFLS